MQLSEAAKNLKPGIYEHFKGGRYKVIGVARHSETLQEMVLYKHLDGPSTPLRPLGFAGQASSGNINNLWVRPLAMFLETVERDGKTMSRFKFIK